MQTCAATLNIWMKSYRKFKAITLQLADQKREPETKRRNEKSLVNNLKSRKDILS